MTLKESERGYPPTIRDATGEAVAIGYALMRRITGAAGDWVGPWKGERVETIPECVYQVEKTTPAGRVGEVQVAVAAYSSGTVAALAVGGTEGMYACAAGQVFVADWQGCQDAALAVVFPESWGKVSQFAAAWDELGPDKPEGPFPDGSERQKLMHKIAHLITVVSVMVNRETANIARLGGQATANEYADLLGIFTANLTRLQFRMLHSFYHHQEREQREANNAANQS